jgi:hypothetical protein
VTSLCWGARPLLGFFYPMFGISCQNLTTCGAIFAGLAGKSRE